MLGNTISHLSTHITLLKGSLGVSLWAKRLTPSFLHGAFYFGLYDSARSYLVRLHPHLPLDQHPNLSATALIATDYTIAYLATLAAQSATYLFQANVLFVISLLSLILHF